MGSTAGVGALSRSIVCEIVLSVVLEEGLRERMFLLSQIHQVHSHGRKAGMCSPELRETLGAYYNLSTTRSCSVSLDFVLQ